MNATKAAVPFAQIPSIKTATHAAIADCVDDLLSIKGQGSPHL